MEYGEVRCTVCRRVVDDWIDEADGALCMRCADDDRDPDTAPGGYDTRRDERLGR